MPGLKDKEDTRCGTRSPGFHPGEEKDGESGRHRRTQRDCRTGTAERGREYVGSRLGARENEGRHQGEGEEAQERRGEKERERESKGTTTAAEAALLLSFNPAAFLCSLQPACPPPV